MLIKHYKKMNQSLLLIKLLFICMFVLVLNNKDKINNSDVNHYIVIILKKRIGRKYCLIFDIGLCFRKQT